MYKRLYRSTKDKMISGVAGGLAAYFDIDPTIVRVLFVLSLFLGGAGVVAYIVLWIVVPEEPYVFNMPPSSAPEGSTETGDTINRENADTSRLAYEYHEKYEKGKRQRRISFAGIFLIVLGILLLIDNLVPRIDFGDLLPVILLIIGAVLLVSAKKDKES